MEREKILKKFNKAEKDLWTFEKLKGPGFLKKIKRLLFLRCLYLRHFLLRLNLLNKDVKAKMFYGRELVLPVKDTNSDRIYIFGVLGKEEEKLTLFLIKHLKSVDVFYDVGANYGFYTFLAEEIIKEGEIHSFEPNEEVFRYLKMNSDTNKIHLNKKALSDKVGKAVLYNLLESGKSGLSSLLEDQSVDSEKVKIDTMTLDEYVKENNKPTFIKIDVEGWEGTVLEGGRNFFTDNHPIITLEIWEGDKGIRSHSSAIKFLIGLGYECYMINDDGDLESVDTVNFNEIKGFENFVFKRV